MEGKDLMKQGRMPIVEALKRYSKSPPAYFCVPGHRFGRGVSEEWLTKEERGMLRYDLTEAYGLDDLHQPDGVIREAQELTAELYGAMESFFLVNGSTAGNEAMVLTAVGPDEEIIVPRNVHQSVLMGLIMSGARPVYVMPEWIVQWGIYGGITPEAIEASLEKHPSCKAVLVVSPSYYGIVSDLKKIGEVCKAHRALLLVDEAHGGHVYFSRELPEGALPYADLCTQSMHKVGGSLTQSSLLHVGSKQVDIDRLKRNLQMVQSSSPSYLLMASLDAARYELARNGEGMMAHAIERATYIRNAINEMSGIQCMDEKIIGTHGVCGLDCTRLTISASQLGLGGFALKELLMEQYNVDVEMADWNNIVMIITYANEWQEIFQVVDALKEISRMNEENETIFCKAKAMEYYIVPEMVLTPREAHFLKKTPVSWWESEGLIAGEPIIPYPPGIPVVYPGERITLEVVAYLEQIRRAGGQFHAGSAERNIAEISGCSVAVIDDDILQLEKPINGH